MTRKQQIGILWIFHNSDTCRTPNAYLVVRIELGGVHGVTVRSWKNICRLAYHLLPGFCHGNHVGHDFLSKQKSAVVEIQIYVRIEKIHIFWKDYT